MPYILRTYDWPTNNGRSLDQRESVDNDIYFQASITSGWISDPATWTRTGAATFTVPGDHTAQFRKGTKIKLTDTMVKYFYVILSSFGGGVTTVTVTGGSDFTLVGAISNPFYSYADCPQGFPDWFNYAASPTGCSSFVSNDTRFCLHGEHCTVLFYIGGVSNAGTFTANLPIQATVTAFPFNALGVTYNNSAYAATGTVDTSGGSTVMSFYTTGHGAWTASNNKYAGGTFTYEI